MSGYSNYFYVMVCRICNTEDKVLLYSPTSLNQGDKATYKDGNGEIIETYVLAVDYIEKDDSTWNMLATALGMEPKQVITKYTAREIVWEEV